MANVLVAGATGLLGASLAPFLRTQGHQVTCLGNTQPADINANLVCYEETVSALGKSRPDVIINLVSLTNVDRCETHPHEAYLLNVKSVENICAWMKGANPDCHLIQVSTDQVYDGEGPHAENRLTIRNYYAMSKLAAEFAALSVPSTILRTNFVGRSLSKERNSFTDWLYRSLQCKLSINVFDDVMFSPLSLGTLTKCIDMVVIKKPLGVFNLGSRDGMSKADFACVFAAALGLSSDVLNRVSSSSVSALVARRPGDMRMNSALFEECIGIDLPRLVDEVRVLAQDYT